VDKCGLRKEVPAELVGIVGYRYKEENLILGKSLCISVK